MTEIDPRDWLGDLQEGEELRGYYQPDGGMSGQGRLIRQRAKEKCPNHSPAFDGTDYVDSALDDTIQAITFGLAAAGSPLEVVSEAANTAEGVRVYRHDTEPDLIDDGTDVVRDRFNHGELDGYYIRYVVRRRKGR